MKDNKTTSIRIPKELKTKLTIIAKSEQRTLSNLIIKVLYDYIEIIKD